MASVDDRPLQHQQSEKHPLIWTLFGFLAQVLFVILVPCLFLFLYRWASLPPDSYAQPLIVSLGWAVPGELGPLAWWLDAAVDLLLVAGFAIPHSLLLRPGVKSAVARRIPAPLVGSLFCWVSCGTLFLCFLLWRPLPGVVWRLEGVAAGIMTLLYMLAWVGLVYSLRLTGFGYQTGWSSFSYYLRQEPEPRREFVTRGAYRYIRHPIYLSFLFISWLTPVMSSAHLLLSVALTIYLFVGSIFKDRRLLHYVGEPYREYARRVPGFPLMWWGPLSRWR